jgi:bifunctional UDP-N-acetylglucosamine pyrophosphorylase/glucosamine-1-phosphate N-acetyltransferase
MSIALIILAAGKGTRMKSDLPKVLHHIAGAPMLVHAMKSGATLDPAKTIIVAGHGAEQVSDAAKAFDETADVVLQTEQLGTAHAVAQAKEVLFDFDGDALVLYGDTPFINPKTLEHVTAARSDHDVVVLGFEAADPGRYGRLIMEGEHLKKIVEFKDASDEERQITLCNSGVICTKSAILFDLIAAVGNDNASGEYYLTDIVEIAQRKGLNATSVTCDESETLGVNSRVQLAEADAIFQSKARVALMEAGVTLHAPDTVYLSHDTHIGPDTIIEPNVVFGASVTVENGANIRAFSHLEGCHVSRGATVGPYARLRPGTELAEFTRVGNFVEIKNAVIDEGAKVNHLSYVGDAHVGARANIGAGTITCNYDGVMKHHTEIGEDSFIGSNTLLVAPVAIGANAMTASGTVVTQDVPDDALAIARSKQINKTGLAVKLFDMLKKKKNNSKKEVL